MYPQYTTSDVMRFWSHVSRSNNPDACWEWQGSLNKHGGYGRFCTCALNTRTNHRSHRVAWELTYGPIPDGMQVLHMCDNTICCNVRHLFLGTHRINMTDRLSKGRYIGRLGSLSPNAKLTDTNIRQIRSIYTSSKVSQRALATQYGVSQRCIWSIVNHRTWPHIA